VAFCVTAFAVTFQLLLMLGKVYSTSLEHLLPFFGLVAQPGYEIPEALGWVVLVNATHVRGLYLLENYVVFGGTIFLYWLLVALAAWYAVFALVKLSHWARHRLTSR
jgi:hypothetical protein